LLETESKPKMVAQIANIVHAKALIRFAAPVKMNIGECVLGHPMVIYRHKL